MSSSPHQDSAHIASPTLLSPDEPKAFNCIRADSASPIVLLCDHASNRVPRSLGTLGVADYQLGRSLAWDIGIHEVAASLSGLLEAPLLSTNYSRLVIDCNRPPESRESVPEVSEGVVIPANREIDSVDRQSRQSEIFWPYHQAITDLLDWRSRQGLKTTLVSLHSFNPVRSGCFRKWDIGVTYMSPNPLSSHLLATLGGPNHDFLVGDNEPYKVTRDSDFVIPRHGEDRGLRGVLIEIRQDLLVHEKDRQDWVENLRASLTSYLHDQASGPDKTPPEEIGEW